MISDDNFNYGMRQWCSHQLMPPSPQSRAGTTTVRRSSSPIMSVTKLQKAAYKLNSLKKKRRKSMEMIEKANSNDWNCSENELKQEQEPKTSQFERGIMAMIIMRHGGVDDKNDEINSGKNNNHSICLICRNELAIDDCCWYCRMLDINKQQPKQQQTVVAVKRSRLKFKQNVCHHHHHLHQHQHNHHYHHQHLHHHDHHHCDQHHHQLMINKLRLAESQRTDYQFKNTFNLYKETHEASLQHYQSWQSFQNCCCGKSANDNQQHNTEQHLRQGIELARQKLQQQQQHNESSLILHASNDIVDVQTISQLKNSKLSTISNKFNTEYSFHSKSLRNFESKTQPMSQEQIIWNNSHCLAPKQQLREQQQQQQQNSKNHNQINKIYKNDHLATTTTTAAAAAAAATTIKSANNKIVNKHNFNSSNINSKNYSNSNNNSSNNNNNNHKHNKFNSFNNLKNALTKSIVQQALRTFQTFMLIMNLQFLQNINNNSSSISNNNNYSYNHKNKRQQQQRINKRLNFHQQQQQLQNQQQRTSNNSNNFFLTFYKLFINSSSNKTNCAKIFSTSPLPQHHSNVQSQQQQKQQQLKFQNLQHQVHNSPHRHQHKHERQHHRLHRLIHFKMMPNLSLLYKILIVLSFLSIILPSSTHAYQLQPLSMSSVTASMAASSLAGVGAAASPPSTSSSSSSNTLSSSQAQARLARNETVCKSMDLRNTPSEFTSLRNCTVIEGFLVMTLVNTHNAIEFTESYPLLTEVTDFIIVYHVKHLRSLSQIFPNLSIIRGTILHEGYALVVYENVHLEDLGLSKLTMIARGGVRIEKNPWLCYVETIDWSSIVQNNSEIFLQKNRATMECPLCPNDPKAVRHDADGTVESGVSCKEHHGKRHCWNSNMCQKICPPQCPNSCIDENNCCHKACLGGCSPHNPNECIGCKHYSIDNSTCIDKCPDNYFSFSDRRCITAESCLRIGSKFENNKQEKLVPFNNTCSTRCPTGYIKDAQGHRCVECGNNCENPCKGGLIDSVSAARELHGCTHVTKELTISIKRGGKHLMEDLEYGLSAIQIIDGYLKVHLTFGLFSLEFFKSLREIRGDTLCENKFALYALENSDLETLWGANQTVRIRKGRVFFHFNAKLCFDIIKTLLKMMDNNHDFDSSEVATDSNGSKGSCNPEFLNTTVLFTKSNTVRINITNPLKYEDERTFIGYQYFYMVDPYKNATKHRHRPCDDSWFVGEPTKETDVLIMGLKPFTQYAYYFNTMTISSEKRTAQSPILFFKTKSSQPKKVQKIEAYSNSSSEIILRWQPPAKVNGKLAFYKVRAKLDIPTQVSMTRNYCKDPLKSLARPDGIPTPPPPTEKPIDADCKCDAKDKTDSYDDESDEANRHDVIEFENTMQNFIYVKHKNTSSSKKDNSNAEDMKRRRRSIANNDIDDDDESSFIMRHIRSLPKNPATVASNLSSSSPTSTTTTTTDKPLLKTTGMPILSNTTLMDPEKIYYSHVYETVNATTNEFVFKNLKHFSTYTLEVEACREPEVNATDKECSEAVSVYIKTLQMDNVDKVKNLKATLESNTTRASVRLKWEKPERPNGAVVSYTILYTIDAKDSVEEKRCITEQDYQNMTNGYLLTGLQGGANYSIKVRANSFAGEGIESEAIFIQTPKPGTMPLWALILIIIFAILMIPACGIGFFWWKQKKNVTPTNLHIFTTVNPDYQTLQYVPDNWEVARERVIQLSPLGQGSFGMVYEGILKGDNNSNEDMPCAVKTVNANATDRERVNFLIEAAVMKQFDTFHVVKLLGVCSSAQPALVVMELMKFGDLKSYLRKHRPEEREEGVVGTAGFLDSAAPCSSINTNGPDVLGQPPSLSRIYQMAIEIADGMAYLAAKKFVHRDLAARNCMVAADLTVKIGDFGMTRDIYETDYYRKGTKGLLPVRWMPPEALRDGVYSSASDVFSYGVVLWEMATLAAQPYQGFSNDQVLHYVIDGGVMERPENCPDKLYELMQKCWQHRPSARPSFMDIINFLLDQADPKFKNVSFYHSDEGQKVLQSERNELQHSGDVFQDPENDLDNVTTPLRINEYNEFQLNLDTNSSVENHGDSPMVVDDHPHSPYSLASANIISSTPDDQLKHSFTGGMLSEHKTNMAAPSTSMGGTVPSTATSLQQQQSAHSYPRHYPAISGGSESIGGAQKQSPSTPIDDTAAYVQPDEGFIEEARIRPWRTSFISRGGGNSNASAAVAPSVGHVAIEADERGYEVYDPSPKFNVQTAYDPADDEEDFDGIGLGRSSGKLSGGQNLLPRQKSKQRLTTIMPMSSSMPDAEVISSAPMSSSAASSNASSNATAAAASGGSKYPTSLKRTVAETVQNVGQSLTIKGLRGFLRHKRTGSNASHKSNTSNPTSSNSHTNLTTATAANPNTNVSHNLGTLESGGITGSYTTTPRFFTPTTTSSSMPQAATSTTTSENPNYKLLDETANISNSSMEPTIATTPAKSAHRMTGSKAPQYQHLKESLNASTTEMPTHTSAGFSALSDNPNYQNYQAPTQTQSTNASSNPNYVMMQQPTPATTQQQAPKFSVNPNYQMMWPQSATTEPLLPTATTTSTTASVPKAASSSTKPFTSYEERIYPSDEEDPEDAEDDDDDDTHTEHIKMERMPLSRRAPQKQQSDTKSKKRSGGNNRSRSRSKSRNKSVERSTSTLITPSGMLTTTPTAATPQRKPTSFSLKEKWLRQQQPPQPPPNGFIGREG